MKRIDPLLLGDMLESIEEVTQAVPEARAEFDADKFRRSHILRHLQIIGEVAWRLSSELKRAHPEIPWKKIAGMRHALVHDYFEIDWHVVYETAVHDIPPLKPQIQAILDAIESSEAGPHGPRECHE